MTETFNREELKARRRSLRNNMPKTQPPLQYNVCVYLNTQGAVLSYAPPYKGGEARSAGVVETNMTEHYNKTTMTQRRRALRKNLPKAEVILWNQLSHKVLTPPYQSIVCVCSGYTLTRVSFLRALIKGGE
jgi:hypothetical protein